MKPVLDGATSFFAALLTLAICGVPAWASHLAIGAGLAPVWAYVPVAGLAFCGVLMTFAFVRKGAGGISPSRSRRRR